MNNTQQLPAEVVEEIKNKATEYANLDVGDYAKLTPSKVDEWYQCREDYIAGATECTTNLYHAQQEIESLTNQLKNYGKVADENMKLLRQENERLQQWKAEASELVNPILRYGQSKETGIPLGESITEVVLERCKQYDAALQSKCDRYEKALKVVQEWQLPATGKFWGDDKTRPMSYGACYGSNGERDFMRNIANEALNGEGEKTGGMPVISSPILTDKDIEDWEQMKKEDKQ